MNSTDGETVEFTAPVQATGGVERWLLGIESMMRMSLCDQTLRTMTKYPDGPETRMTDDGDGGGMSVEERANRSDWLQSGESGQMILLVDQIMWTRNTTRKNLFIRTLALFLFLMSFCCCFFFLCADPLP